MTNHNKLNKPTQKINIIPPATNNEVSPRTNENSSLKTVGVTVGDKLGSAERGVGETEGDKLGSAERGVGETEGDIVGNTLGELVGDEVGYVDG